MLSRLRCALPAVARFANFSVFCVPFLVVGCASSTPPRPAVQEKFGSDETYSRLLGATPTQSCEAARRALLSQGYIITSTKTDLIDAKKNFQPAAESQQEMMIRVVCVPESNGAANAANATTTSSHGNSASNTPQPDEQLSLVFVTAIQDSYALKKSNSSASLGLGGIGSVSLPFASSSEALVKVGSETISSGQFYDSFFDLVRRYLADADIDATLGK
jgi:hypothetical protein